MVNKQKTSYEAKYGKLFNPLAAQSAQTGGKKGTNNNETITVLHEHIHEGIKEGNKNIAKQQSNVTSNTRDIISLLRKLKQETFDRRRILSAIANASAIGGNIEKKQEKQVRQKNQIDNLTVKLQEKVREAINQQQKSMPVIKTQKFELNAIREVLRNQQTLIQTLVSQRSKSHEHTHAQKQPSKVSDHLLKKYNKLSTDYKKLYNESKGKLTRFEAKRKQQAKAAKIAEATLRKKINAGVEARYAKLIAKTTKQKEKTPVKGAVKGAVEGATKKTGTKWGKYKGDGSRKVTEDKVGDSLAKLKARKAIEAADISKARKQLGLTNVKTLNENQKTALSKIIQKLRKIREEEKRKSKAKILAAESRKVIGSKQVVESQKKILTEDVKEVKRLKKEMSKLKKMYNKAKGNKLVTKRLKQEIALVKNEFKNKVKSLKKKLGDSQRKVADYKRLVAQRKKSKIKKQIMTEQQLAKIKAEKTAAKKRKKVVKAQILAKQTADDLAIKKKQEAAKKAARKKLELEKKKRAEEKKKLEAQKKAAQLEKKKQLEAKKKARAAKIAEIKRKRLEAAAKAAEERKKKADTERKALEEARKKELAEAEQKKKEAIAAAKAKALARQKAEEKRKAELLAKKKAEEAARRAAAAAKAVKEAKDAAARKKALEEQKRREAAVAAAKRVAAAAAAAAKKALEEKRKREAEAKKAAAELRAKRIAAKKKRIEIEKQRRIAAQAARDSAKRKAEAARKAVLAEKLRKEAEVKTKALIARIELILKSGNKIVLQAAGSSLGYLRTWGNKLTSHNNSSYSTFIVINHGGSQISLYNEKTRKILSNVKNTDIPTFWSHNGPWYHVASLHSGLTPEKFTYTILNDGRIILKNYRNKYLKINLSKPVTQRIESAPNGDSNLSKFRVLKVGYQKPTQKMSERERTKPVITNGLIARYVAADFYYKGKKWDSSYGSIPATEIKGNSIIQYHRVGNKVFKAVRFNKEEGVRFNKALSKPQYTLIVVGRNRRNNGRVIDGLGGNILHGWWGNRAGVFYQQGWITNVGRGSPNAWHVMAANNGGKAFMDSTQVGSNNHQGKTPSQWTINWGASNKHEWTNSDIAEIMFYSRRLSSAEMIKVSDTLRAKYGIPKWFETRKISTKLNDSGQGNSVYLDRHTINCGKGIISQFKLNNNGKGKINYNATCIPDPNNSEYTKHFTPLNDDGRGNTVYLDKHNIDCKNQGLISRIKLVRGGNAKKVGYEYTCKASGVRSCSNHSTPWNDEGAGKNIYLDRHNVSCPPGKALKRVKLTRNGKGKYRYDYTCCLPGTTNKSAWPVKKELITGLHHMKNQRIIQGKDIPWSSPGNYTISYWIKTNPGTRHWRNIFRWGNKGSNRSPAGWLYCCHRYFKYHFRQRTQRCCGTNIWAHGGNDGVDMVNMKNQGFRYYKWNHILTKCEGRLIQHWVNGRLAGSGYLPDQPLQLKNEKMYVPDWTGDHQGTYLRNFWWYDGSLNTRQIREVYKQSKFTGWNAPAEIPRKVLIEGTHHLKNQKKIAGKDIPWTDENRYTVMYWVKTNPTMGHWRNIFRWGNYGHHRSPAAWFWCCGKQYSYHYRQRTRRCCGTNVWSHGGNDGVDAHNLDKRGFRFDKWNHITTVVYRKRVTHYLNGKVVARGNLPAEPKQIKNDTLFIPEWTGDHDYTYLRKMIWFDGSLNNRQVMNWYNKSKFGGWNKKDWRLTLSTKINKIFRSGNTIALFTHKKRYIGAKSNGEVYQWSKWVQNRDVFKVFRLPGNQIALYNISTKRYLNTQSNNRTGLSGSRGHYTHLPKQWTWERYEIEEIGGGQIGLRSIIHNKYVRAHNNYSVDSSAKRARHEKMPGGWAWEKLTPIEVKKSGTKWVYINPIEIRPPPMGVVFYEHCDYQGKASRDIRQARDLTTTTMYNKFYNIPKGISSIRIPSSWQVVLYSEDGFKGESVVLSGNQACLTRDRLGWNDRAKSVRIRVTDEKLHGTKGDGYRGSQNRSRTGRKCQKWAEQSPHKHSRTPWNSKYKNKGLTGNVCRNPDGEPTIWCYTKDSSKRWEFCDPIKPVIGRFIAENYRNDKTWINKSPWKPKSGSTHNAVQWKGNPQSVEYEHNGKRFKAIRFTRNDGVRFPAQLSTSRDYSIIVVGRNIRGNGRVVNGTTNNCLHGWWNRRSGVYHYGNWLNYHNRGSSTAWGVCAANNIGECMYNNRSVRSQGLKRRPGPKQWTVNWGQYQGGEWSISDIAEVMIFDRLVRYNEMRGYCKKLMSKYGIRIIARYVYIKAAPGDYLHMRELRVYEDENYRNISYKKRTSGSRQGWGGKNEYVVDGKFPTRWPNSNHTHKNGWWQVDLGRNYGIIDIKIWNRPDCCQQRLGGAKIMLKNSSGQIIWKDTLSVSHYHHILPGTKPLPIDYFTNGRRIRLYAHYNINRWVLFHHNGSSVYHGGWNSSKGYFYVKRLPQYGPNCVALFNYHTKRYLRARNDKKTIDQSGSRGNWNDFPNGWVWERFFIEYSGGKMGHWGDYCFRTVWNTYLRANKSTGKMDQSAVRSKGQGIHPRWEWERFKVSFH